MEQDIDLKEMMDNLPPILQDGIKDINMDANKCDYGKAISTITMLITILADQIGYVSGEASCGHEVAHNVEDRLEGLELNITNLANLIGEDIEKDHSNGKEGTA